MRPVTSLPNPPAAEQPALYSPPAGAPNGATPTARRQGTTAPQSLRIEPLEDRISPGIIWGD